MAVYNTASDAANTAVRAFLTEIGEYYYKGSFNTGSGMAKQVWVEIRDSVFKSRCVYCRQSDVKLQIEHLQMFNRVDFGLHHPGNIVPACSICNARSKNDKGYNTWQEHLSLVCKKRNEDDKFQERFDAIYNHFSVGKYKYPELNAEENHALRIIAKNLYDAVKTEFVQAVKLFEDLNEAYNKG